MRMSRRSSFVIPLLVIGHWSLVIAVADGRAWAAQPEAQVQSARLVINGCSGEWETPVALVGGKPYIPVSALQTTLGAAVRSDENAAKVEVVWFNRSVALDRQGAGPTSTWISDGVEYLPLEPLARAFGWTLSGEGVAIALSAPVPYVEGVRFSENDERFRMVIDLSSASAFRVAFAEQGVQIFLTAAAPFVPQPSSTDQPVTGGAPDQALPPPPWTSLSVGGVLGLRVTVQNVFGNGIRVMGIINYPVPQPQVLTLGAPSRIVVDFPKIFEESLRMPVSAGIVRDYYRLGRPWGPVVANAILADPSQRAARPVIAPAGPRAAALRPTSEIARRIGALAAINGGYFDTRRDNTYAIGLAVFDGEWWRPPFRKRSCLVIVADGRVLLANLDYRARLVWGDGKQATPDRFNEWLPPSGEAMGVYTRRWGDTYPLVPWISAVSVVGGRVRDRFSAESRHEVPVPQGAGDFLICAQGSRSTSLLSSLTANTPVTFVLETDPAMSGILFALAGGPRLVVSGQPRVSWAAEQFSDDMVSGRRPISAVGLTADQRFLMLTVDGRQRNYSHGLTMDEAADLLVRLGARDAMALDGGGSTTMVVGGQVVNQPSDGCERAVANVVALVPSGP